MHALFYFFFCTFFISIPRFFVQIMDNTEIPAFIRSGVSAVKPGLLFQFKGRLAP